jgi:ABC-type branched-subunit amino acid transport system substrate-binding protein
MRIKQIAVLLAVSLMLVSCDLSSGKCIDPLGCWEIPPNSPIEIGTILTTNGHLSSNGTACLASISVVVKGRRSIFNHPIELENYATDGTPESAREAATAFATNPQLLAVIGPSLTGEGSLATSILSEAGVMSISPVPDPQRAKKIAEQIISAIEEVAIQKADQTLIIPRQALRDALEPSPLALH